MEQVDRYEISILWIKAMKKEWTHEFVMKSLSKSGIIPFTRLRHLEGNKCIVDVGDCILRAEEICRQEDAFKLREVFHLSIKMITLSLLAIPVLITIATIGAKTTTKCIWTATRTIASCRCERNFERFRRRKQWR